MMNKKEFKELMKDLDWSTLKHVKFDVAKQPDMAKTAHEIIQRDKLSLRITTLNALIPDPKDASKQITTTLIVDFENGFPVRQIDGNDLETLLTYNDNQQITSIQRTDGHFENMTYHENGELLTWENSNGSFEKNIYENGVVVRHESSKEGGYWVDFIYGEDGKVAYTFDKKDAENPFIFEIEKK